MNRLALELVAIGLVAIGVWLFWQHYEHVLADKAALQVQVGAMVAKSIEQGREYQALQGEMRRRDQVEADRRTRADESERQRRLLDEELAQLKARDKDVAAWTVAPLPRGIIERLRNESGGRPGPQDGAAVPAAEPRPGVPAAAVGGRDERGAAPLERSAPRVPEGL
jgi:hypothetical protein